MRKELKLRVVKTTEYPDVNWRQIRKEWIIFPDGNIKLMGKLSHPHFFKKEGGSPECNVLYVCLIDPVLHLPRNYQHCILNNEYIDQFCPGREENELTLKSGKSLHTAKTEPMNIEVIEIPQSLIPIDKLEAEIRAVLKGQEILLYVDYEDNKPVIVDNKIVIN